MKTTVLLLLVLTFSATAFCSNTLSVPEAYPTIQEAIDASSPGDTIVIAPGTYAVNIVISADVELRAEIADSPPVLKPASWDQAIIRIEGIEMACSATLTNLILSESYGIAVFCGPNSEVSFADCTFRENEIGLFAHSNAGVIVSGCEFLDQYNCGVQIEGTATLQTHNS